MGISKLHTLYGMDVGGTLIGGITEQRAPQGTTVQADPASGLPYPTAAFVTQHAPRPAGTTQQVLELLTAISAKGGAYWFTAGFSWAGLLAWIGGIAAYQLVTATNPSLGATLPGFAAGAVRSQTSCWNAWPSIRREGSKSCPRATSRSSPSSWGWRMTRSC